MARGTRLKRGKYIVSTAGGANYEMNAGIEAWAGTTLSIAHGFDNLVGISFGAFIGSAVSVGQVVITTPSPVTGSVSAALQYMSATGGASLAVSGGSISWTAFGYDNNP